MIVDMDSSVNTALNKIKMNGCAWYAQGGINLLDSYVKVAK